MAGPSPQRRVRRTPVEAAAARALAGSASYRSELYEIGNDFHCVQRPGVKKWLCSELLAALGEDHLQAVLLVFRAKRTNRDFPSQLTLLQLRGGNADRKLVGDIVVVQAAPNQRGIMPVSYTHLRAHETPEHLV